MKIKTEVPSKPNFVPRYFYQVGFAILLYLFGYWIYSLVSENQQDNRADFAVFECSNSAKKISSDQREAFFKICITKKLAE